MKTETSVKTIDHDEYLKLVQPGNFYTYQGLKLVVVEKTFESLGNNEFQIHVSTQPVE
jgi:hypothetical protein